MYNNYDIFKYLESNKCDHISKIKGIDLKELLYYVNLYYLELRDCLNIDKNSTFGIEIECESADKSTIKSKLNEKIKNNTWIVKKETSVNNGAEINSPILSDKIETWRTLKKVCDIAKEHSFSGDCCGGHIHMGAHMLKNDVYVWKNFIDFWATYENIIFRFLYGDYLNARETMNAYSKPLKNYFDENRNRFKNYNLIHQVQQLFPFNRNYAINMSNLKDLKRCLNKNTIEFRCPNGTFNPIIWQNNINLIYNIIKYVNNCNYDYDIVEKRRLEINKLGLSLDLYNQIFLQQSLEFCDLIFERNIDKIYFLRQYLKSFEISDTNKKAKKFTNE